ncbi:unnamed protein product [Calypogeia fissa]
MRDGEGFAGRVMGDGSSEENKSGRGSRDLLQRNGSDIGLSNRWGDGDCINDRGMAFGSKDSGSVLVDERIGTRMGTTGKGIHKGLFRK